ncbi:pantothenate kinase 2-like [Papaver somniferum]|uniref:pantothenate kinase 2-like n=1 Tax=Papaver somniferum TaxID=3469 RepID=UPI000E6F4E9D|nr:pantothenate kinase 2-like [Papaver somniferum]
MAEISEHHVPEENNPKSERTGIQEDLPYLALDIGGTDPESKQKGIAAKVKVTGAGAHKFADLFMEKIGVTVEKEDEMDCNPKRSVYLHRGKKESVAADKNDLFPYLYVNIGSGVVILKIEGDGNYEAVDGTRIGGITCWGLGRLLTKCKSLNEIIELSKCGNIKRIDLFVEDTFGDREYVEKHAQKLNAPPNMNIRSFGKTISENKTLEDCDVEDLSLSLLQMFSLNIAQIASLNARLYGIKRIFFGGSFIKDNTCALEILSSSVHYHSKGTAKTMFLRHEGFVGALGALMSYENKHGLDVMDDESQDVETTLKSTFSCHDPLWNFRD